MNPELRQLEKELKQLQPESPPRTVVERLEAELGAPAPSAPRRNGRRPDAFKDLDAQSSRWGWMRPMLALAALLALSASVLVWSKLPDGGETGPVAAVEPEPSSAVDASEPVVETPGGAAGQASPEPGTQLKPRKANNRLLNRIDEGIVFVGDGLPARQYRYQFVDTLVWEDPADGSEMTLKVPREEIVLVPIHTF